MQTSAMPGSAGQIRPASRRRYRRLYVTVPIEYQVRGPDPEASWSGHGVLKNISIGGLFFRSERQFPGQPGDIHDFTFFIAEARRRDPFDGLSAQGRVVRLEPPTGTISSFGVAVEFLSTPAWALS